MRPAAHPRPAPPPTFEPKLLSTLRGYTREALLGDLTAGVIVGIVALPLAIAFAIASGVPPDRGLTTAVVAGFLISALGGSRVQIGGPTGAFVVIVYGIVQRHGVDGLAVCTLMAGGMLVLMGVFRLGAAIKFIPYPVTVGFTSGIAVIIFSSQIKDLLGLATGPLPADFMGKWAVYLSHAGSLDPRAALASGLAFAILLSWPKLSRRIPGSIVAILAVTALVHLLGIPVETIGSRFGEIPSGLPRPSWPKVDLGRLRELVSPAFTVALLGAIESLLSATVADGMIEARHRSNTELIAQGVANLVVPFFGGIPATGAIARTATNVRNGGRTPVAGMVHALTLLSIMIAFGRWARLIPLCVLGAILVVVSYHMSEWRAFRALLRAPRSDVAVLLTTFLLTVLVDLTVAVEVGMLLSLVLFMKRMTDVSTLREVTEQLGEGPGEAAVRGDPLAISRRAVPPGVAVYEAEGAFFFGAAELLRENLSFGAAPPKVLILRMRHVLVLDATGIRAIRDLRRSSAKLGTRLLLSGVQRQPLAALQRSGTVAEFGEADVLPGIDEALRRARELL